MKCPICGNEIFVEGNLPFEICGEGEAFFQNSGNLGCYACTECGYTILFDKKTPKIYKQQKERLDAINDKIEELNKEIKQIHLKSTDFTEEKKLLARFHEELDLREKWGEESKATRSLKESIKDLETLISSGVRPDTEQQIANVRVEIRNLQIERGDIQKRIKPFNEYLAMVK